MQELAHAAQVFRPVSGMMASRFTSSASSMLNPDTNEPLISMPSAKRGDPAEEAARLGMYGPMTRTMLDFYPTRLVCKRFNVRPPAHVQVDPGGDGGESSAALEVVSKDKIDRMMQDAAFSSFRTGGGMGFVNGGVEGGPEMETEEDGRANEEGDAVLLGTASALFKPAVVDVERNDALEGKRPGDEIFKAIFGSDDDDDD